MLAYASVTGDWALAGQAGLALLADGINRLDPAPSGNPDPSFSYSWEFGGSRSYASGGSSGTSNGESASTTGIQITYGDDESISGNFDYDYYEQVTISLSAQSGLKPTDAEYQLVAEGKLAEMWQGRCAAGDPIGCVGFATWGSVNDVRAFFGGGVEADYWVNLGTSVQINARTGLLEGNPSLRSGTGRAYLSWVEKQMGKAIATAHLNATAAGLTNRHYFLSAPEITSYHHTVFVQFNVRREWYGGSYFDGTHSSVLESFYCRPSCDSH